MPEQKNRWRHEQRDPRSHHFELARGALMHRLNIAVLTLWLAIAPAFAQMNSFFPGPGTVHSTGGGSSCSPVPCIGDTISGASFFFSPSECYQFAYSGNMVLLVDGATGNTTASLLKCSGGVPTAASGALCSGPGVSGNTCSPIATTCAVSCVVYNWFDQSGNGLVFPNPILALMPFYTSSCQNSLACLVNSGSNNTRMTITTGPTVSQPITYIAAAMSNDAGTGANPIIVSNSAGTYTALFYQNGSATVFSGTASISTPATKNVWHALVGVINGSSSLVAVDGVDGTAGNSGSGGLSGTLDTFTDSFAQPFKGDIGFFGAWPIAATSGQRTTFCHYIFQKWATATSC